MVYIFDSFSEMAVGLRPPVVIFILLNEAWFMQPVVSCILNHCSMH